MTPRIRIIGGNLSGLITAYRLLPYGFRIDILECTSSEDPLDQTESLLPIWPGFFNATWSLLQELALPWLSQTFQPAPFEITDATTQRLPLRRFPVCGRYHVIPELLFFGAIPLRDRVRLLNVLEKKWESRNAGEATPDTQTVEQWVATAQQSPRATTLFWNPLCRWLLSCDISEASVRTFLELLSRYAHGTAAETRIVLGAACSLDILKRELRSLLIKQNVQFHSRAEYPLFLVDPNRTDSLILKGSPAGEYDALVVTLPPHQTLSLMPERVLTRFSQLNLMAKIPRQTGSLLSISVPNHRIPPSFVLGHQRMVWMAVEPSTDSHLPGTRLTCLFHDTPGTTSLSSATILEETWPYLEMVLGLPASLSFRNCPSRFIHQALTFFPAQAGTRAFRPQSTSPIPNLFFSGPWTATPLPHSMESLVVSANTCAEALAQTLFSRSD